MTTRNVLLSVLVGLGVASCGENQPPPTTDKPALTNPKPYGEASPALGAPQIASATPVDTGMSIAPKHVDAIPPSPIPPSNAQWTISCDTLEGPGHVAQAEIEKQRLIQVSHMPDWYAIHTETRSEIYYGYYGALNDPKEKRRQEGDRARISGLLDRLGNPMVRGVVVTPVSMPDPATPSDWNLLNTPRDAYWTIEFATFVDGPDLRAAGVFDRKRAAVAMVRHYREELKMTNVYYYHGSTVSSVCVGAWKREAMAEQGTRTDAKGQMRDDASTQSPDQPLLVIPDIVPANMPSRVLEPGTGKSMAVQALKRDVVDPDMKAMMVKFHDHSVNGQMQGQDENGQFVANASMIVEIPHDQAPATVTDDNWRLAGGQVAPAPQPRPQGAGDDVLRSIGGH